MYMLDFLNFLSYLHGPFMLLPRTPVWEPWLTRHFQKQFHSLKPPSMIPTDPTLAKLQRAYVTMASVRSLTHCTSPLMVCGMVPLSRFVIISASFSYAMNSLRKILIPSSSAAYDGERPEVKKRTNGSSLWKECTDKVCAQYTECRNKSAWSNQWKWLAWYRHFSVGFTFYRNLK